MVNDWKIFWGVVAFLGVFVGAMFLMFAVPEWRHRARVAKVRPALLQETMHEGAKITAAIAAYTRANQKPPASLQALVPTYLPAIPAPTRLMADGLKSGWQYEVGKNPIAGKWALWVWVRGEYRPNRWSFGDIFAYHPSSTYAREDYGGVLERVGAWGYYHE